MGPVAVRLSLLDAPPALFQEEKRRSWRFCDAWRATSMPRVRRRTAEVAAAVFAARAGWPPRSADPAAAEQRRRCQRAAVLRPCRPACCGRCFRAHLSEPNRATDPTCQARQRWRSHRWRQPGKPAEPRQARRARLPSRQPTPKAGRGAGQRLCSSRPAQVCSSRSIKGAGRAQKPIALSAGEHELTALSGTQTLGNQGRGHADGDRGRIDDRKSWSARGLEAHEKKDPRKGAEAVQKPVRCAIASASIPSPAPSWSPEPVPPRPDPRGRRSSGRGGERVPEGCADGGSGQSRGQDDVAGPGRRRATLPSFGQGGDSPSAKAAAVRRSRWLRCLAITRSKSKGLARRSRCARGRRRAWGAVVGSTRRRRSGGCGPDGLQRASAMA